jgi:ribonuclease E
MEDRFGLRIAVIGDPTISTEMFAIDKGEASDMPRIQKEAPDYADDDADDAAYESADVTNVEEEDEVAATEDTQGDTETEDGADRNRKRRRRRRRGGRDRDDANGSDGTEDMETAGDSEADGETDDSTEQPRGKKRRRSRGRRGGKDRNRQRIPDAEPVGPLADTIAARGDPGLEQAEEPQDEVVALAPAVEPDIPVKAESVAPAEAEPAEADVPAANDNAVEEAPQAPRKRATAETLDLEVEPVLTSDAPTESKPKKSGWWSRKGFF